MASQAQSKPSEYQVKAVYLFDFSRFIEWPNADDSSSGRDFRVCVLGKDPFGALLDAALDGEKVDGQNVVAKRITKNEDVRSCRILFVSRSEDTHLADILTAASNNNALTVSDMPGFSERGGMIEFVMQGDRVRFEINLASTSSAGLVLSSELLKVALTVKGSPAPKS